MKANGVDAVFRRRSRAEAERLVSEFKQSGLRRKEFCAAHGLSMHTLDAWRRRIAGCGSEEKIVPVEIVEGRRAGMDAMQTGSLARSGQFRVVLSQGLRIEIEPGFDAAELRRLITVLDGAQMRDCLSQPV
jgi:transposase-like protein